MLERQYVDFKLYLTRPNDDQVACQVALLPTAEVGESMYPEYVPAESAPRSILFKHLARKSISGPQLLELGKSLADCLLPEGQVRDLFAAAHKHYGNQGGVRLRLIIADNELRAWPWEFTYLNTSGGPDGWTGFLALDPRVSFVRHEPLALRHSKIEAADADADIKNLHLLMATAQPAGSRELELEHEVDVVKQALADFEVDGVRITCDPVLMNVTRRKLAETLQRTDAVYAFHFAGHGDTRSIQDVFTLQTREQGVLLLVKDEQTQAKDELSAETLAGMLAPAGVRLVVLGACLTGSRGDAYPWDGVAGALVAHNIPAVVAMQHEVVDEHAVAFADMFYTSLASGLSLDEAMSVARKEMHLTEHTQPGQVNVEWGVPVLYTRSVDGNLFPERMAHAGQVASDMRMVISQTVAQIDGGAVTGVRARRIKGGVEIKQDVDTVSDGGVLLGLGAEGTETGVDVNVGQDIDRVGPGADVTGVDL